jgi:ribose-phosphate pyrophosphokinase
MITANGIVIKPTIFPDGTSQIWNLPESLFSNKHIEVDWRFESEREILDLFSLRELMLTVMPFTWSLYVPYLPYARQDKEVSNESTFNLRVIAKLINQLGFHYVKALDVHNPDLTKSLINRFENITITHIHQQLLLEKFPNSMLVYPDQGAFRRYEKNTPYMRHRLVFQKKRDQSTGKIVGHELDRVYTTPYQGSLPKFYLILDDICDGGATFISIAKQIRLQNPAAEINLFVTHGLFSKGIEVLNAAGVNVVTTDSLMHNANMPGVFKV